MPTTSQLVADLIVSIAATEEQLAEVNDKLAAQQIVIDGLNATVTSLLAQIEELKKLIPVPQPTPPPVLVESKDGESIPPLAQLVVGGKVWMIVGGHVLADGKPFGATAEAAEVFVWAGKLYHNNLQKGGPWLASGTSTWTKVADPRPVVAPAPVPAGKRRYGNHWMHNFTGFDGGHKITLSRAKAFGQTLFWVHGDRFKQSDTDMVSERKDANDHMQQLLDAAVGTDTVIVPGMHGNWYEPIDKQVALTFMKQFVKHPSVFQEKGVPVIAVWDYRDDNGIFPYLWANGFPKGSFRIWANPNPWDGPRRVYAGLKEWLVAHPEVDGFINFAVDLGGTGFGSDDGVDRIIERNFNIATACRELGRTSVAGWAARYYGVQFSDAQIIRIWEAILRDKPDHVIATTGNDLVEESYVNDIGTDKEGNNVYIPTRGTYRFDTNIKYPVPIQTRFSTLVLPYVQRFLALP